MLFLLGVAEEELQNGSYAAELFCKVMELDPDHNDAHYHLALNLSRLGKKDEAIAHFRRSVELNPYHRAALYNLFRSLAGTNPEEAEQYRKRFQALQDQHELMQEAKRLEDLALTHAKEGSRLQAIEQLRKALEVCGECLMRPRLHKNLGLVYGRAGDLKNAKRELSTALEMSPDDPEVKKSLEILESLEKQRGVGSR